MLSRRNWIQDGTANDTCKAKGEFFLKKRQQTSKKSTRPNAAYQRIVGLNLFGCRFGTGIDAD